MKKILLAAALGLASLTASAAVDYTNVFSPDFATITDTELADWKFIAPDGTPAGDYSQFFPNYAQGECIAFLNFSGIVGMFTPSQYKEDIKSDNWIITPEIEIVDDTATLAFSAVVSGILTTQKASYQVMISETGGFKEEDFTLLKEYTIRGNASNKDYPNTASSRLAVEGMKGKKVRFAFVNKGNNIGILGFYGISCGSWFVQANNPGYFDMIYVDRNSDETTLKFKLSASTPVNAKGFKATLTTASGFTTEIESTRTLRLSSVSTVEVEIPGVKMSGDEDAYTITMLPNFEGARPAVFSGNLVHAEKLYPSVAVLEELTGTWCGWCPAGLAQLNYYHDRYPDRCFPVALHSGDVMNTMENNNYVLTAQNNFMQLGFQGYPFISINREIGWTPTRASNNVLQVLGDQSVASLKGTSVCWTAAEEKADVYYNLFTGINASDCGMNVAAIVLEDGVNGTGDKWLQQSYLPGQGWTEAYITNNFGSDMLPYFKPYLAGATIKCDFDHVARNIFPDYNGAEVKGEAVKGQCVSGSLSFVYPETVVNLDKTSVLVIATKRGTGEVLAAELVKFADFGDPSGIDGIADASALKVAVEGNVLNVNSESEAEVNVYSVDGALVKNVRLAGGNASVELPAGMLVVKVRNAQGEKTLKTVVR